MIDQLQGEIFLYDEAILLIPRDMLVSLDLYMKLTDIRKRSASC